MYFSSFGISKENTALSYVLVKSLLRQECFFISGDALAVLVDFEPWLI